MKQISLKLEENLNKLLEERINTFKENLNLDMSKNRALIKILTHALINDNTFEEILLSRGPDKPINKAPDQPIDKPIKEKEKRDGDYFYPDFMDRESSTPNLLDIRKLKNYVFVDNFCNDIKDGYDGVVWVLQQKDPDEEQYIEEPDPNEPDDY